MNISKLEQILSEELDHDKRRVNCLAEMVQALYISKSANLSKVARSIKHESKVSSRYRRLQRFFNGFDFELGDCAAIVMNLFDLGDEKPYLLMDRTEWEYGKTWVNILMVAVAYKRAAIPLGWVILPGRGNSSREARSSLLDAILARVGADRFEGVLADREFIGSSWFADLNERKLSFYIRVKEGADTVNELGQSVEAGWLFHHLRPGEQLELPGRRKIYGHKLKVWGARSPVNGELMVVVSNDDSKNNIEAYLQRWDIETLFGSLKSKGFDFEATHMVNHDKISRLIFVLTLAYVWALKAGIAINQRIKVIPFKNHGRKLYSLFRVGLDFLCEAILTSSARAIKFALRALTSASPPPLRPLQIRYLRSFVVY